MAMGKGPDVCVRFGRRVRNLREEQGLSQEAFAAQAKLDRSFFGSVERGERNVTLVNVERIAVALGVPIRELFEA